MNLKENIRNIIEDNNLVEWFLHNNPPESYAFWNAPEMDLIYNELMTQDNNITAMEFSVACVELKKNLKLLAEAN